MNKLSFLIGLFVVVIASAAAQVSTKGNDRLARFHSYNTVQLLNGSNSTSVALVSVNGFQLNHFFTGIGVGYDYYFRRTAPLFAEVRYDFGNHKRKLQLFADFGANFLVDKKNGAQNNKTGRYWSTGFDYYIPVHKDAFTIGVGYSSKQVIYFGDNFLVLPVEGWQNVPIKYDYLLNRIAIRCGWVF
jgi:hypothetical protein